MILERKLLTLGSLALTIALGLSLPGCSGGDEPEEPAAEPTEDGGDAAEAPAAEPAEGEVEPEEMPAAEPAPEAAVPATPAAPATAAPAGFDGPKVWKFVRAYALNVRTGPGKDFPVKRHVKYGDKVEVVINGEWAKLGDGEYISANKLVDREPKKGRYK